MWFRRTGRRNPPKDNFDDWGCWLHTHHQCGFSLARASPRPNQDTPARHAVRRSMGFWPRCVWNHTNQTRANFESPSTKTRETRSKNAFSDAKWRFDVSGLKIPRKIFKFEISDRYEWSSKRVKYERLTPSRTEVTADKHLFFFYIKKNQLGTTVFRTPLIESQLNPW